MLLFDIGANRGDATQVALDKGYQVVALEPAPKVFRKLVKKYIYEPRLVPLKYVVSDKSFETIEFYECIEDGLSSLSRDWLTKENMPYAGKEFRTIQVVTITLDDLVKKFGKPDLIKIDVEGAEWSVFKGMNQKYGTLTFEWTDVTLQEHQDQLHYLESLGYEEVAPQFIVNHLQEPIEWFSLNGFSLENWLTEKKDLWINGLWKEANLRPTADVGMLWVR